MEKLTISAINTMIDKILDDSKNEITENIFSGTNESMKSEKIFSVMMFNCLSLSMKLSVQVTLDLLQSAGNLQIDEHEIAKLYLKHLSLQKGE